MNPAKTMGTEVGLHFLDEPTNDLDIATLTVLEDYLDHFPGIVITVSHDRYFPDRIARRIFAFEGNKMAEENSADTETDSSKKTSLSNAKDSWKKRPARLKFSYKEQKDYETIEGAIAASGFKGRIRE